MERAHTEAQRLLQQHFVEPLEPAIQEQIDLILREYDREMAAS
jgi:trimethylamine:corrinoid methyltransferase-like protein